MNRRAFLASSAAAVVVPMARLAPAVGNISLSVGGQTVRTGLLSLADAVRAAAAYNGAGNVVIRLGVGLH